MMDQQDYDALKDVLSERPRRTTTFGGFTINNLGDLERIAKRSGFDPADGLSDEERGGGSETDADVFTDMSHGDLGEWLKEQGVSVPRSRDDRLAEARRVSAELSSLVSLDDTNLVARAVEAGLQVDPADGLSDEERVRLVRAIVTGEGA